MTAQEDRKTTREFWEASHGGTIRLRLPSLLNVATRDILRLLDQRISPGVRVLEVGFAPGKHLAYVAKKLGAQAHGVDYSDRGVATAQKLFDTLGLNGDLRCQDFFENTFPRASFDFVYSIGLVEHFEDPRAIIRLHVESVKPGGRVMIAVPNYGGIYGQLQRRLDPENLAIHNLRIMSVAGLLAVAPQDLIHTAQAFPAGRPSPWILSFHQVMPLALARLSSFGLNAIGLILPFEIPSLCPLLVLDLVRRMTP